MTMERRWVAATPRGRDGHNEEGSVLSKGKRGYRPGPGEAVFSRSGKEEFTKLRWRQWPEGQDRPSSQEERQWQCEVPEGDQEGQLRRHHWVCPLGASRDSSECSFHECWGGARLSLVLCRPAWAPVKGRVDSIRPEDCCRAWPVNWEGTQQPWGLSPGPSGRSVSSAMG